MYIGVHVPNIQVPGTLGIVCVVQVLGKYMLIEHLGP